MRQLFHFFLILLLLFVGSSQALLPGENLLLKEAQILLDSAQYDLALQRGQQALQQAAPGQPDAAACLLLLGDIFLETGKLEAAHQQYSAALNIYTQKLGSRHLATAEALNRLGEYFYKKTDYTQAAAFYQNALQIREASLGGEHQFVADGYNNLGNCQVGQGDYAAAIALHQKALAIRQNVLPKDDPDLATSFNNLGNCAYLAGDPAAAVEYFKRALAIREKAFGQDHPKTAQVLNNLGNACDALGLREEAIQHYRRALDIRRRIFGNQHATVASALENIADLCIDNGDHIAALDFYRQAYNIQRDLQGEQSPAAASLWHKIGLCYQYEGDFDRALAHHLAAMPVLISVFGANHPNLGGLYNTIGNCYAGKDDPTRATEYYEKALRVFQQGKPLPYASTALVYNNLGNANLDKNQYSQALDCFQRALEAFRTGQVDNPGEQAVYLKNQGIALERLNRWPEAKTVLEQAMKMANSADPMTGNTVFDGWATLLCQRGLHTGDTAMLRQSIAVFEASQLRSDSLRAQLSSSGSRQRWVELQFPAYASAMEAYYGLWEKTGDGAVLEKAFALAERNKSVQLLEQLRKEQAEQTTGIPDTLLQQERHWRTELNLREKELLTWQRVERSGEAQVAAARVAEARQAVAALMRRFEQEYPDYYRLKYDRKTASPADIQQHILHGDQALLEYYVSDSAIFVFVVTSTDFRCLRLARNFPLDEWVSALRHSLQAYPNAGESVAAELARAYTDQAYQLFEAIIAPVQKSIQLPENLIVVPDGTLAYLPFECLLAERPADFRQFKSHHYLIRDHCFSYAYSASQQLALLQTPRKKLPKSLLAVAPVYGKNRYGLEPLQNNHREAQAVSDLFQGTLLEGASATVPAFTDIAGQYRILLLAMHGKASSTVGDMSYIAFSAGADTAANPFLYARDLYNLSIPAELVVLSACETSVGSYRFGQGVISLAKGFFQAGARSVAATLWSVDDAKNAELMQLFFQEIKNGATKDVALRTAKLSFLDRHPHDEANPVYWGAVGVYGDMRGIEGASWWLWIGLLLVGAGVVGFFKWRRGRTSIQNKSETM